jgi:hypothetical protein
LSAFAESRPEKDDFGTFKTTWASRYETVTRKWKNLDNAVNAVPPPETESASNAAAREAAKASALTAVLDQRKAQVRRRFEALRKALELDDPGETSSTINVNKALDSVEKKAAGFGRAFEDQVGQYEEHLIRIRKPEDKLTNPVIIREEARQLQARIKDLNRLTTDETLSDAWANDPSVSKLTSRPAAFPELLDRWFEQNKAALNKKFEGVDYKYWDLSRLNKAMTAVATAFLTEKANRALAAYQRAASKTTQDGKHIYFCAWFVLNKDEPERGQTDTLFKDRCGPQWRREGFIRHRDHLAKLGDFIKRASPSPPSNGNHVKTIVIHWSSNAEKDLEDVGTRYRSAYLDYWRDRLKKVSFTTPEIRGQYVDDRGEKHEGLPPWVTFWTHIRDHFIEKDLAQKVVATLAHAAHHVCIVDEDIRRTTTWALLDPYSKTSGETSENLRQAIIQFQKMVYSTLDKDPVVAMGKAREPEIRKRWLDENPAIRVNGQDDSHLNPIVRGLVEVSRLGKRILMHDCSEAFEKRWNAFEHEYHDILNGKFPFRGASRTEVVRPDRDDLGLDQQVPVEQVKNLLLNNNTPLLKLWNEFQPCFREKTDRFGIAFEQKREFLERCAVLGRWLYERGGARTIEFKVKVPDQTLPAMVSHSILSGPATDIHFRAKPNDTPMIMYDSTAWQGPGTWIASTDPAAKEATTEAWAVDTDLNQVEVGGRPARLQTKGYWSFPLFLDRFGRPSNDYGAYEPDNPDRRYWLIRHKFGDYWFYFLVELEKGMELPLLPDFAVATGKSGRE